MRQALIETLRDVLARETRHGRTVAELLVEVLVNKALAGDVAAIKLVFQLHDGQAAWQAAEPAPVAGRIDIEPAGTRPIPPRRRRAV